MKILVLRQNHGQVVLKLKNILEKRRIKIEKNEDESCRLFTSNSYSLQNMITKASVLSDHKMDLFWFIEYFRKYKRELEGTVFKNWHFLEKTRGLYLTYSALINLCSYIYEFWLVHTCFRHRPRHKGDITCLGNLS